mmetsp:Transcript_14867/g.22701  ORF Transcript_14867/g.22701 Transcript_14867/m.22701 type:complete len:330 (+) Transcript_14867:185-1174(+)|eukprot:CAMPEP_0178922592 /NCGR_PEP_ID=MMETSP0786-20121207/16244_1 /TAXON_ID=186022 /ORGANISM="Thalassionema frauenfeldii, Strain CCMP 1798" /LENGTH=329 /DNA_ID=CAMNT_0020596983 /DNA_START=128 /DNA_END=1117 /DNA_ORIENTATION=+
MTRNQEQSVNKESDKLMKDDESLTTESSCSTTEDDYLSENSSIEGDFIRRRSTEKTFQGAFDHTRGKKWSLVLKLFFVVILSLLVGFKFVSNSSSLSFMNKTPVISKSSIFVPGVGFSGFWFALGNLQSLPDPTSQDYYCFSAGCLVSVAVLNGLTVEEIVCMALSSQTAWKEGRISRFEVVSTFVDQLLLPRLENDENTKSNTCLKSQQQQLSAEMNNDKIGRLSKYLSKLHILTTNTAWRASMRTPNGLVELHEMLIQTAWIPFVTGNQFFHNGHMDGGFSLWEHPRCEKYMTLPLTDAKLALNSLNFNLGKEDAYQLWKQGLAKGL